MAIGLRGMLLSSFLVGAVLAGGGCYHIKGGPAPLPSGGPGPTATPTPAGTCQPFQTSTNQIVDISQGLAAIVDPTYGPILGYALDPQNGTLPTISATITLKPSDLIQFANIDAAIAYSAVGFGTNRFPPVPFTFPSGTQFPVGNALSAGVWSTGRIPPGSNFGRCYSQQFKLPGAGGVVYFGDFDHYNATNGSFRDVIIVSNSAPQSRYRRR
jgi:hypothetical protein